MGLRLGRRGSSGGEVELNLMERRWHDIGGRARDCQECRPPLRLAEK